MVVQSTTEKIERVVTGQERRFLFAPTANIALVLRVHGSITEVMLTNAIQKMLVTYPMFKLRMQWDREGVRGFTTEDADPISISMKIRENESTWKAVLNAEHSIVVRPSKGPLTRFMLVKGEDVSEIIILCHHAISDGRSLEFAMREIILHLNDPDRKPPKVSHSPPQTPDLFPKGTGLGKVKSWFVKRVNKKWAEEKVVFDEEDLTNIWDAFWKNSEYLIDCIELNDKETRKLIEISRDNDVTLNSTLLIALLKARIEAVGEYDEKAKIATAVDSRKKLREDCTGAIGFYAGGSFLDFEYDSSKSFWENVRAYHKRIYKQLDANKIFETVSLHETLDQTLSDAMIVRGLGDLVEPAQSRYSKIHEYALRDGDMVSKLTENMSGNTPQIMSTNLGQLHIPHDMPIRVERAFFTPSAGFGMEMVLGIATIGDRLTITLNYYKGYTDPKDMGKVRKRAISLLTDLFT